MYISIHAPTRGATETRVASSMESLHFNPRSHERSDKWQTFKAQLSAISIHAPTRGATVFSVHPELIIDYFNPRSHERSDVAMRLFS